MIKDLSREIKKELNDVALNERDRKKVSSMNILVQQVGELYDAYERHSAKTKDMLQRLYQCKEREHLFLLSVREDDQLANTEAYLVNVGEHKSLLKVTNGSNRNQSLKHGDLVVIRNAVLLEFIESPTHAITADHYEEYASNTAA